MAPVIIHSDFGDQKNKVCPCFQCLPIYLPCGDGTRWHDVRFVNVEFWASFFTFLFYTHQKALNSSLLSSIRVVSSLCLSLLIFLPAILITAYASSSPAFHIMYSVYKLNKQGYNIQPWHNSFPNFEPVHCSISSSNCCFLSCIQISQETGKVVWYSHLLKNFPVCCDAQSQRLYKSQWSRNSFLEVLSFLYDSANVGNLISGSSAFSIFFLKFIF